LKLQTMVMGSLG